MFSFGGWLLSLLSLLYRSIPLSLSSSCLSQEKLAGRIVLAPPFHYSLVVSEGLPEGGRLTRPATALAAGGAIKHCARSLIGPQLKFCPFEEFDDASRAVKVATDPMRYADPSCDAW